MSDNVVKIRCAVESTAVREPVPEIVEAVEQLLADAKAGRIRSLAFAGEADFPGRNTTGCALALHTGGDSANGFVLLGGLTALQARVARGLL